MFIFGDGRETTEDLTEVGVSELLLCAHSESVGERFLLCRWSRSRAAIIGSVNGVNGVYSHDASVLVRPAVLPSRSQGVVALFTPQLQRRLLGGIEFVVGPYWTSEFPVQTVGQHLAGR
jgi:hypothetical protein